MLSTLTYRIRSGIRGISHSIGDLLNAVRDRCLGIDAEDSPVEKYYLEIRRESERQLFHWKNRVTRVESKLENQAKKIKKEKDQNVNRLKTQKDVLQSQIDSKRTQLDRQHSLLRHATAEYEKANSNYSDWREALGRPPYKTLYRSLLESVRYDLSVERGTITEKKVEAPSISSEVSLKERNEGFWRRMFAWLASILGYIVVPFDVYYAYPGFQAILNEPKYATVAAFLFGLILLSIGTLLAALTQQLFNRKPESIRPTFKAVIPSRALLLFIVLALGLATVFAGATIRSIVPESQHISQRRVEIQLRIQQIQQFDVNESTTGVDLAQRQADLEYLAIEDKQLSDDAKILSMVLSPVLTADAILAFCFYLFALVSVFCSRILSTDPVFEYHIASLSRESAQRALLFYESKIEEGIGMADRIVTTLNGEIAELEADKLEEIDRSADEQAEEERIEVEAHEKQYYADLRYRCLRYAKYLSLLRRDKNIIRQWEEYFDRVSTKS